MPGGAEPLDHMGEALGIGNFDGNSRADLAIGLPFNGDGVGDVGDPGAVVTLHGSSSLLTASGALFSSKGPRACPIWSRRTTGSATLSPPATSTAMATAISPSAPRRRISAPARMPAS